MFHKIRSWESHLISHIRGVVLNFPFLIWPCLCWTGQTRSYFLGSAEKWSKIYMSFGSQEWSYLYSSPIRIYIFQWLLRSSVMFSFIYVNIACIVLKRNIIYYRKKIRGTTLQGNKLYAWTFETLYDFWGS